MTERRYDAALLDLDGTLVDTLGDFEVAIGRTLAALGLAPVTRAFIARTVGKGGEHLIRSTLVECGAATDLFAAAWPRYQAEYRRINGQFAEVYPGVAEGLARLADAGLALACVTNKPVEFAQDLLRRKDLAASFRFVLGGDSLPRKKPDPLPLHEACRRLGTVPPRTLMVGDSANDAAAARAAGCPVVLVRHGYNHGEPVERVDADGFVDRLDEIAALSLWTGPAARP